MLGQITSTLSGLFSNKKFLLVIVVAAIFIALAVYIYNAYIAPRLNPQYVENKEFEKDGKQKEAELYMFYTTWCPHCKKAKPEWEKLKTEFENKPINNTIVHFREVDCDKDEKVASEFKVEGYPTIKLVKDGQVVEYDAKPNYDTLVEFLHTTL
jgi:thiol-disulfide isomerase/thioredoxin